MISRNHGAVPDAPVPSAALRSACLAIVGSGSGPRPRRQPGRYQTSRRLNEDDIRALIRGLGDLCGVIRDAGAAEKAAIYEQLAAVAVVAAVAGWVSYSHALAVVRAHGETGPVAWACPLTIDGLPCAGVDGAARRRPARGAGTGSWPRLPLRSPDQETGR